MQMRKRNYRIVGQIADAAPRKRARRRIYFINADCEHRIARARGDFDAGQTKRG